MIPEEPVFLIKIDVEGCECEVLRGGRTTVSRARYIIAEAHTPEALSNIRQEIGPEWRVTQVGASDYLFRRVDPAVK